jgi:hypothetical protein
MILWPSNNLNPHVTGDNQLPNPTTDLSGKVETSVIRTKMDSGRPRQRQRFTTGLRTFTVGWEFTEEQFKVFQGIYHHYLSDGADWFQMSLPIGNGFETLTVRFTDSGFTHKYADVMHWKVTATLETENICPVSKGQLDALITLQ